MKIKLPPHRNLGFPREFFVRWRPRPDGFLFTARFQLYLVLALGTLASALGTWTVWSQVATHQRMEFEWVAQDRNHAFRKGMEDALRAVLTLADLIQVTTDLQAVQFRHIATNLRERFPGIERLEWVPRVPADSGVSADRQDRFPVRFSDPESAGLDGPVTDLSADPVQRALIERARRTGGMVASERIPLDLTMARYGVTILVPLFEPHQSGELRGVIVGMLSLANLANRSIALLEPRGVEFLVQDESAPAGHEFLDFYASRLGPEPFFAGAEWVGWSLPDGPRIRDRFPVADRHWSITSAATQRYLSAEGFKQGPWIVLVGGLALTALLSLYLRSVDLHVVERTLIEQELRESEQKLRILFNQSPDIIMTVNDVAQILLINRTQTAAPATQNASRSSVELLPAGLRDWYLESLKKVFQTGEPEHFQYSVPDSSWWEIRIVPLRVSGLVTAAMVIATDVTQKHILEAQAIRNARLATLGVLAASVAHEVNNPNNAIQFNGLVLQKSFADLVPILEREAAQGGNFLIGGIPVSEALDGIPKLTQGILRNTQRIQTIVAGLKHMARQDKGDYDQMLDVEKVLQSVFSILQHQIQKYTNHCHMGPRSGLPPVRGNAQQLEQVLVNLVLNALQALPNRDAQLCIGADYLPESEQVRISVVDQGVGISDENLKRIFDPFFTTRPDQGGTGLGLSISQRIVQNHGGFIELNSQVGSGTEAIVHLPVASSTATKVPTA